MTNLCLPSGWRKTYAVLWAANHFVASETPKRNTFDLIDENLISILNITEETLFLSFDGLSNYLYPFKKQPS